MTTETVTTYAVTASDIKALRGADDITFHTTVGEQSTIRAHKRARADAGWSNGDQTYDVSATDCWTDYGRSFGTYGPGEYKFAFCSVSRTDQVMDTVLRLLKPGDELMLHWIVDNNSQTLTDAGLHSDELRLRVKRASMKEPLVFSVDTSICPDNSARMVRRHRW